MRDNVANKGENILGEGESNDSKYRNKRGKTPLTCGGYLETLERPLIPLFDSLSLEWKIQRAVMIASFTGAHNSR